MARSKSRPSVGAPPLHRAVADLRALAHPLRLRMMELFAESPKTTKQVAELLGQPPTRLYHHVTALERAGLLVLKETRQNRGAVEKWYVGVSQQLESSPRAIRGSRGRHARRAVAAAVLEQAKQELMAIPAGAKQTALLSRMVVVAPAAEVPALRARMFEMVQSLRTELQVEGDGTGGSAENCERWALTVALTPVTSPSAKRRAR